MDPRRPTPSLVRSKVALRGLVTAITFTTFGGMTAFAATHLQNSSAPLRPSADGTTANAPAATAAPAVAPARGTVTGRVATTTAAPRTRTHSS